MVIFANVRNRASRKIKMVRLSVGLEDHIILSNSTYNLIKQNGIGFVV